MPSCKQRKAKFHEFIIEGKIYLYAKTSRVVYYLQLNVTEQQEKLMRTAKSWRGRMSETQI